MRQILLFLALTALTQTPAWNQFGNANRLQSRALSATAPSDTYVICWDASASTWKPCPTGGSGTAIAGDVTGSLAASTVVKLQNRAIASTAPSDTNTICWDAGGSTWKPCAGSVANSHTTFSNVASVAITVTGVADHAVVSCFDNSTPPQAFIPDHIQQTDANTLTVFFVPNATGYCNVATGVGATGATGATGPAGGVADPGSNGIMKRTALNVTAPAVANTDYLPVNDATATGTFTIGDTFLSASAALPVPAAPTVTVNGTTGATTYSFFITWLNAVGQSAPGATRTITNGNATLNFGLGNTITVDPGTCPSGVIGYIVYKSAGGSNLGNATAGFGASQCGSPFVLFQDTAAPGLPTIDTSTGSYSQGFSWGCGSGAAFPCDTPALFYWNSNIGGVMASNYNLTSGASGYGFMLNAETGFHIQANVHDDAGGSYEPTLDLFADGTALLGGGIQTIIDGGSGPVTLRGQNISNGVALPLCLSGKNVYVGTNTAGVLACP